MCLPKEQIELIKNSNLFDKQWYLDSYKDVREMNIDPIEHYVTIGHLLLRDPSPNFSTSYYLKTNPNVAKAKVNPFYHYLKNSEKERKETVFIDDASKQKSTNHQSTVNSLQSNELSKKLQTTERELLETKQENELLLLQLHQVQEELELLYLSQHQK